LQLEAAMRESLLEKERLEAARLKEETAMTEVNQFLVFILSIHLIYNGANDVE
uniref:PLEC protein n=1 Tax=Anisakis simplex TaxID=6269 RepID=A0A0M3JQN9_ANISI